MNFFFSCINKIVFVHNLKTMFKKYAHKNNYTYSVQHRLYVCGSPQKARRELKTITRITV